LIAAGFGGAGFDSTYFLSSLTLGADFLISIGFFAITAFFFSTFFSVAGSIFLS
jgi:hypothetical protein